MDRRRLPGIAILLFLNLVVWTSVLLQEREEAHVLEVEAPREPRLASPEIRSPFQEPIAASADVTDALLNR